jgi:hypothetical protein
MLLSFTFFSIVFAIDLDWGKLIDPIYEMFMGNATKGITGMFEGNTMLLGAFILIIFLILTMMFGLGMLVGTVVIIPALFAVFGFIPDLRIIIAIIAGLLFGLGLHKLVRR